MFGDSYVFVVFEDGTDLYWARSQVLEYIQQIQGRLPQAVPRHRADGAGWTPPIRPCGPHASTRPGGCGSWIIALSTCDSARVAELRPSAVLRRGNLNIDPEKLRAYGIPAICSYQSSRQHKRGRRRLPARRSRIHDPRTRFTCVPRRFGAVPLPENGTPVLVRDLGTVTSDPIFPRSSGVAGRKRTVGGMLSCVA
jgi:Cu(I)/Ag(I) efflux system membrane protein CusA/SilA